MRALILIAILGFANFSFAQAVTEREHPRVAELQDKMTDYVRGYLQTRLQGVPFMVTVKIEAMRRKPGSRYTPQAEKLPYYDLAEEEIRDEWDDPSASLYALQARVQKTTVLISVPQELKDAEVTEIQDSLSTLLRLVPGRDDIKIERRPWSMSTGFWNYVAVVIGALAVFLVGLLFISRAWATRLSTAIHEIKPKERNEDAAAGSVNVGPVGGGAEMAGGMHTGPGASGDVSFRDPLRTREFIAGRITELVKNPGFPSLLAMIEMEKVAQRAPADLGALLMEFPFEKQKELFGLSFSTGWLSAFTDPGELSGESVLLADRLCRLQYDENPKDWEHLIVQCWRLESQLIPFLKSMSKDDAFAVLKSLPASIAVPAGRAAFPGAWAVLLDPDYKTPTISAARVKELYKTALGYKELNSFEALDMYKQEKDLLEYLAVCSVAEERDIYGALPKSSFLWQVRPPFFSVLELDSLILQAGFNKVSLDDWALAMFNVSRDYRKTVEAMFNSKQKFLFTSKMRTIDQNGVDKNAMGSARQRIARLYHEIANQRGADEIMQSMEQQKNAA